MLKIPRFVKEYANYKAEVLDIKHMTESKKYETLVKLHKPLKSLEKGIITVEEAMKELVEVS